MAEGEPVNEQNSDIPQSSAEHTLSVKRHAKLEPEPSGWPAEDPEGLERKHRLRRQRSIDDLVNTRIARRVSEGMEVSAEDETSFREEAKTLSNKSLKRETKRVMREWLDNGRRQAGPSSEPDDHRWPILQ